MWPEAYQRVPAGVRGWDKVASIGRDVKRISMRSTEDVSGAVWPSVFCCRAGDETRGLDLGWRREWGNSSVGLLPPGLLSRCAPSECLLVLEAGVLGQVGRRKVRETIFVISCGCDQRGKGENSSFSLLSCG